MFNAALISLHCGILPRVLFNVNLGFLITTNLFNVKFGFLVSITTDLIIGPPDHLNAYLYLRP
ncbi:hypothetical protein HO173_004139 [Letharia columbiana]|uniref:Uncharacterized protein n=1 Tax=Letharia columbiana TaxID=112416 RepID=A0A8H6L6W8_9LECA|nr:uncharacterized protein HO173_004139 [Letharia columbiana]KAF6237938.1 hypothetical protein HO173_004139 [Letharia columbiana]